MEELKILLVEDESVEAMDIKRTLESFGYEVPYVVLSGAEAIEKATEIMPDLILMDIVLKGESDGIEAVSKIKDLNIPVIYLTAHSEDSTIERAKLTEPYGYIIKPYDVTELKHAIELAIYKNQMEKKLKNSEKQYKTLYNSMSEGLAVHKIIYNHEQVPVDYKILNINPAFEKILGIKKHNILGKKATEAYGTEKAPYLETYAHVAETGTSTKFETYFQPMGKYFSISVFSPSPGVFATVFEDITQRKKSEKAIIKSKQKYSHLFSSVPVGILISDMNTGHILDANKAMLDMAGYTLEEFKHTIFRDDFVYPEDYELILKELKKSGKVADYEIKLKRKDRKIYKTLLNSEVIEMEGDKVAIATIRDISERKKGEEYRKRGEKAIRESEEKYRAMMDYSSDAIFLADFGGNFVECNKKAEELLGYSQDELHKLNFRDIHPSEELEVVQRSFKKIITDDMGTVDTLVLTKDNKKVPVAITGSLIEYGDKKIIQGVFRDITQWKKAEEALLNSNKALMKRDMEFRHFIDGAPVAIAMFDKQMRYIAASLRWVEDYNLKGKELRGVNHYDVFPEITDELKEVHKRALAGSIIRGEEDEFVRADGSVQYIRWEVHPWYLSSGDIGGIIIFSEDVSERRKAEKAFKDNEEKYRTLFESNPDYTILVGWDGVILDFNVAAEQIIGISKEELVGKHFMELGIFLEDELDLLEENFSHLFKHEDVAPFEFRIIDKNGDVRWGETSLTIIKKDNVPAYILVIFSDITERKQAENKIIQSLQEKEVLLREVHHRVKNNMQIISSLLNLQIKFEDLDEIVGILKESQGRVKSMAMVHEKLYQSDNFTNINFKEYITKLVTDIFYSYGITTSAIELVFDIDDINLNIDTAIPLGLIINELVTNSVKYAFPQGEGTIKIKLKSLPDEMQLTIADNGIGVPEDFDIENIETLGLQLVNSLTDQIDGDMELDRINGTEFKITFKELKYKERL